MNAVLVNDFSLLSYGLLTSCRGALYSEIALAAFGFIIEAVRAGCQSVARGRRRAATMTPEAVEAGDAFAEITAEILAARCGTARAMS